MLWSCYLAFIFVLLLVFVVEYVCICLIEKEVHELPQSHCCDNREDILPCVTQDHIYYIHTHIYIYICIYNHYIYIYYINLDYLLYTIIIITIIITIIYYYILLYTIYYIIYYIHFIYHVLYISILKGNL